MRRDPVGRTARHDGGPSGSTATERRRLLRRGHLRDQRLADLDVELVHFGWEDVVPDARHLARRLRAAFTRGNRRTGEPPIWSAPDREGRAVRT